MRFEDNFAADSILFVPIGFLLSHIHFLKSGIQFGKKGKKLNFSGCLRKLLLKYRMFF